MGLGEKLKDIIVKPYKSFENKFIPLVNAINNYLDKWVNNKKKNKMEIIIIYNKIRYKLIIIILL